MSIAPKGWHPDDRDDRRVRELAQKFLQTAATSNFDAVMAMTDPNSSEPEAVSRENYRRIAEITGRFEEIEVDDVRSEEHTSELQSLMRISYAVFCLKKKNKI